MARQKIRLAPRKDAWAQQFKPTVVKGPVLSPPPMAAQRWAKPVRKLIAQMHREAVAAYTELFTHPDYAMDVADVPRRIREAQRQMGQGLRPTSARWALAMERAQMSVVEDASIASRARVVSNKLAARFDDLFGRIAKPTSDAMVNDTEKHSSSTLTQSLKELSGGITLKADFVTEGVADAITASVAQSVNLIKRISSDYLGDVQGAVMRSITSGEGLKDLIPFMNKKYEEQDRHAELTALDQTRKAYTSITVARMDMAGIDQFEWVHTAGSKKPRAYHANVLNGQIFSMDDLPIIDEKTGTRGLPGQLPFCRCKMRPIIDFSKL